MALNGITQAVVVPGHQKVWQESLKRLGYSDADIEAYIPNLGHTCWWLFGNLEGEGGPLPQDGHLRRQPRTSDGHTARSSALSVF